MVDSRHVPLNSSWEVPGRYLGAKCHFDGSEERGKGTGVEGDDVIELVVWMLTSDSAVLHKSYRSYKLRTKMIWNTSNRMIWVLKCMLRGYQTRCSLGKCNSSSNCSTEDEVLISKCRNRIDFNDTALLISSYSGSSHGSDTSFSQS